MSIACWVPGCARSAHLRKMCPLHYSRVAKKVRRGETTWAQAEADGECPPAEPVSVRHRKFNRSGRV
jgi:hypothetical protein